MGTGADPGERFDDGILSDGCAEFNPGIFGGDEGDAAGHVEGLDSFLHNSGDIREFAAGIDGEDVFGGDGGDGFEFFAHALEDGEGVGEVVLAFFVVGLDVGEGVEEVAGAEHPVGGVYFFDLALLGRGVVVFDDAGEVAGGIADDAAVAGGVGEEGGGEGDGGFGVVVFVDHGLQGLGADEGAIAAEDDDVVVFTDAFGGFDLGLADHDGVAGAFLFVLDNPGDVGVVFVGVDDAIAVVADDEVEAGDADFAAGVEDVGEHGAAADFVEDFDAVGFHAGGFAGGEDDGGEGHSLGSLGDEYGRGRV